LPDVAPVKMMVWPVCTLVSVMFRVLVPLIVEVEVGVAPVSVLPRVILTVSPPVVILLLYWSWACMVTLKAVPAACGELMLDTW